MKKTILNAFTLAEGVTHVEIPTCQRKIAFTLAEVLITLGIIGVVAAMTMPSLIANHREKQTVSQLKKSYSTIQQAFLMARNEYGPISDWSEGTTKTAISQDWYKKLSPYMQIIKHCGVETGDADDCMGENYATLNRNRTNIDINYKGSDTGVNFVLSDGSSVRLVGYDSDCKYNGDDYCGNIYVDVNGAKKPNQIGKDYFYFGIRSNIIIPGGSQADKNEAFHDECNMQSSYSSNGDACTAWVLLNENMDYLKCNDLDWNTKTKCK